MFPLRDTIPSYRFPVVNVSLIIVNALIFLYEVSLGPQLEPFLRTFGVVPARFFWLEANQPGQVVLRYYPLFTSMFLHGGWFHLIGNMWYLWIFGDNVEDRLGHGRYFVFYILCGLAAGFTHLYLNSQSQVPTIGASGAIAGVMGAYFLMFPYSRVITAIFLFFFVDIIEIPAFFFLGIWVFMQFVQGTLSLGLAQHAGGVAWWAHFGGFVAGALFQFVFRKRRQQIRVYRDQFRPW